MRVTRMTMRAMCHCKMRATCSRREGSLQFWGLFGDRSRHCVFLVTPSGAMSSKRYFILGATTGDGGDATMPPCILWRRFGATSCDATWRSLSGVSHDAVQASSPCWPTTLFGDQNTTFWRWLAPFHSGRRCRSSFGRWCWHRLKPFEILQIEKLLQALTAIKKKLYIYKIQVHAKTKFECMWGHT